MLNMDQIEIDAYMSVYHISGVLEIDKCTHHWIGVYVAGDVNSLL